MEKSKNNKRQSILPKTINGLFLKLDELDQEDIRKRLNEERKKLFATKKLLKEFKIYAKQIKLINSSTNNSISIRDLLLSKGMEESQVEELEKIYSEYLKVRELIKECNQSYKKVLKEFQTLVSNNYEYSQIYNEIVIRSKTAVESSVNFYLNDVECSYEDATCVAYEGLAHAIVTFDYNLGCPFTMYAKKLIKRIIARNFKLLTDHPLKTYLAKKDRDDYLKILKEEMKESYNESELTDPYNDYIDKKINDLLSDNCDEAFSDIYDLPNDTMLTIKADIFVDQDCDDSDEFEIIWDVADENARLEEDIVSRLDNDSLKIILEEILKNLDERKRRMLELYYGEGTYTLEKLGNMYNVTRERARVVMATAMRELRSPDYREKFRPFCEGFKYFRKDKEISKKEIYAVLRKLYKLGKTNFSNETKALFCSTSNITFDAEKIEKFEVLINSFLINMQLDEKNIYRLYIIIDEFYNNYLGNLGNSFPYKYPYGDIYRMLQKLREEDESPEDIKTLLNKPHLDRLMGQRTL